MSEISIRSYTRRSWSGKSVKVRGYTRRVGRKGIRSPKKERSKPGEEFENKQTASASAMDPIEAARIKAWQEDAKQAEKERKTLGMSKVEYQYYKMEQHKRESRSKKPTKKPPQENVPRKKEIPKRGIFERMEDKLAKYVKKYSGKTYKRQF